VKIVVFHFGLSFKRNVPAPVLYSRLEIVTALRPSFDGWDSNPDLGGECAGDGFGGQEKKSNGHGSIVIYMTYSFLSKFLGAGFALNRG